MTPPRGDPPAGARTRSQRQWAAGWPLPGVPCSFRGAPPLPGDGGRAAREAVAGVGPGSVWLRRLSLSRPGSIASLSVHKRCVFALREVPGVPRFSSGPPVEAVVSVAAAFAGGGAGAAGP